MSRRASRPRQVALRRRARGQAAAMMAVTLMLIAVMVCVTIGIGMKAREKVEVQNLADASAYSGAVVTARTLNSIALLNRVAVADMVSAVATQSLVSYGSYYRAMLSATAAQLQMEVATGQCGGGDCCVRWGQLINAANNEAARVNVEWQFRDGQTHQQIRNLLGAVGAISTDQANLYRQLRDTHLTGSSSLLANFIVQRVDQASHWQGELTVPGTADPVNLRELGEATDCDPTLPNPVCADGGPAQVSLQATMGTRWYQLETNAANLTLTLEDALVNQLALNRLIGEDARVIGFEGGTRYAEGPQFHASVGTYGLLGEAWEGALRVTGSLNGCTWTSAPVQVRSLVYASSIDNADNDHVFQWTLSNGVPGELLAELGNNFHAFGPCPPLETPPCGMWPGFVDLNPGLVDPAQRFTHLYGQAKVTAVVQRDYMRRGARADPWNLLYNATIRPSDTETFDNNGLRTAQGLDISRQTAVATGLVYYHRHRHWREPPNFFNPYWRATLVSGAIDSQGDPTYGGTDLVVAAGSSPYAPTVITQLAARGFRGWQ